MTLGVDQRGERRARVLVLPGDGIGPEVTRPGVEVMMAAAAGIGIDIDVCEMPAGGSAIEAFGDPFPAELAAAAANVDAVLLGAVGYAEPPPPGQPRPEATIFGLRRHLDAFANLRPVVLLPGLEWLSPLRPELSALLDIVLVREVTGGLLSGAGGRRENLPDGARAEDGCVYDEQQIRRVVELACDVASRRRGMVASIDKANALATGRLWRDVAGRVAAERGDAVVTHMLVDAAAARLVADPGEFDVLVTENLFGDILSDVLAGLGGSVAVVPSASIGSGVGLFEPVHGSAPDIAGRGVANPIGMIRTVGLLFAHGLGVPEADRAIGRALERALRDGFRTADIARPGDRVLGTEAFGERVVAGLELEHAAGPATHAG